MHAATIALLPLLLPAPATDSYWRTEIAFETRDKLGGCAVGELDPLRPGNEVALVAGSGAIHIVGRDGAGWSAVTLPAPAGEMIQCAIGDADPSRPGQELVVVGMESGGEDSGGAGAALLLFRGEDGAWQSELLFRDKALIHGVAVSEGEVFVAGYSGEATRIAREGGDWQATPIAKLPGAGKSVAVHDGALYVACTDGTLLRIERLEGSWKAEPLDEREAGRSRLGTCAEGVVVSDDDGVLSLIGREGRVELYAQRSRLRGAVMADLDPSSPGLEAATAGYAGRLVVLYPHEGSYQSRTILVDTAKFHHVAAGELGGGAGIELAACGYAGRLYVLTCVTD